MTEQELENMDKQELEQKLEKLNQKIRERIGAAAWLRQNSTTSNY